MNLSKHLYGPGTVYHLQSLIGAPVVLLSMGNQHAVANVLTQQEQCPMAFSCSYMVGSCWIFHESSSSLSPHALRKITESFSPLHLAD